MLRGLYTAGTAMLSQARRMDVVTNNIANVETTGYKQESLATRSFRDMVISRINDPSVYTYQYVGPHNTGIHVDQIITSFEQGPMVSTGVNTDIALYGEGFFVVQTPDGTRYTRNGAFNVDADGNLVTPDGFYVLGEDGAPLNVGSTDFSVNDDGYVTSADGALVGRMARVQFADTSLLRKEGESLFYNADPDGNPAAAANTPVRQTFLEGSNVNSAREMVSMIEVYRHYEINQRIINMINLSLTKTVNDIARF